MIVHLKSLRDPTGIKLSFPALLVLNYHLDLLALRPGVHSSFDASRWEESHATRPRREYAVLEVLNSKKIK